MRKINVLQFICPTGFYGAEMWILAMARNLDHNLINYRLAVTQESEGQDIEIYHRHNALGFTAHKIEMKGRFDPRVIFKLSKLIKKYEIDIIHTHGYKSDILGLVAARKTGIRAIATPHGFENANDLKLQLFILLGCRALRYFDRVLPVSDELRADMQRIKVASNKVKLIQNGVDLSEIEAEKDKTHVPIYTDNNEKKICYVGQMAQRKNIIDLIKTFDLLYKKNKNIRLILIGDGPQKEWLEEQSKSMESTSKIDFLGYRRDRLAILKETDLFSMSSSLEGIPRCMMEAMAMEIPVAAYNIPGVDKLIINGKTGLMAAFGHVEGLKKCWEQLLFDKKIAEDIARNGREHIIKKFSAKRMADEYAKLYQEIMNHEQRA